MMEIEKCLTYYGIGKKYQTTLKSFKFGDWLFLTTAHSLLICALCVLPLTRLFK